MTGGSNSIADDILRNGYERWQRLEGEKQAISDDLKELFQELKSNGFDGKALRAAFRMVAKAGDVAVEEHNAMVDLYVDSLTAPRQSEVGTINATRRRAAREAQPDPIAALRADPAMAIVDVANIKKSEPQPAPAARDLTNPPSLSGQVAPPSQAKTSTDGGATEQDIETPADSVTGEASRASNGAGSVAPIQPETANEKAGDVFVAVKGANARLADAVGVEPSPAALSDHTSKSTAVHTDAGKTGVTGGESAAKDGGQKLSVSSAPASAIKFEDSASDAGQAPSTEQYPPVPMKRLPYADCFPAVLGAAYERLGDDIATNGVQRPIVRMGDVIVDGWARYNICRALSVEYPVIQYSGNDVLMDVIAWQRRDRDFTPAQEKQIAAKLVKAVPHRAADILAAFDLAEEMAGAE